MRFIRSSECLAVIYLLHRMPYVSADCFSVYIDSVVVIKVFGYVVLCERMLEVAVGFKYLFNACQSQLFGFRTVHVLFTSAILYL